MTQDKATSLIMTHQQGRYQSPNPLTVDQFRDSFVSINKVIANKKIKLVRFTELSLMDDETYGAADELKPLPKC